MLGLIYEIHRIISECLGNEYSVFIGNIDDNKEDTASIGIYSGINPETEFGDTLSIENTNLLINLHTHNGADGVEEGFNKLGVIRDRLSELNNHEYSGGSHSIINTRMVGNINFLGNNKYNIPLFSMSLNVSYK